MFLPRRAFVALALPAFLLVAGCTTPGLTSPAPDDGALGERTFGWTLTDCRFVVAIVPVSAAGLADRLPEGFRSLALPEFGLPDDPRGDANLGIESFTCQGKTSYGSLFTFVEPPAELADPEAKFHFVKWETLVADAPLREALAAAGAPVLDGTTGWGTWNAIGDSFQVDGSMDLGGTYTFQGAAPAPAAEDMRSFRFVEYMPTDDGRLVAWQTTVTTTAAGQGGVTVGLPAGWARDVAGGASVQAYGLVVEGSFEDGSVHVPAAP